MPETATSLTATLPDIRANADRFVATWLTRMDVGDMWARSGV